MKFSILIVLSLLCGPYALPQFEHPDLKSHKKRVSSLLLMPIRIQLTRLGMKGAEPIFDESRDLEETLPLEIGVVLQALWYKVDQSTLSQTALDKDSDLRYTVDDLQKRFDGELQQINRKSKDVRKGRFTLGDEVAKLPLKNDVDALLFVRVRAQVLTDNKKTFGVLVTGQIYDTALMEFGIVDAKTGDVLFFSKSMMQSDITQDAEDTAEHIKMAFSNLPKIGPKNSAELEVLAAPQAAYPAEALQRGIEGEVVVKMLISTDGNVNDTEVVSGDPILAKAAAEAARRWKFKPYMRNGEPVKVSIEKHMEFSLRDQQNHPKSIAEIAANSNSKESANPSGPATPPNSGGFSASGSQPKRIRVSQQLSQGLLFKRVQPEFPPIAAAHQVEGQVVLQVVIDRDGHIAECSFLSGPIELRSRDTCATVKQWRYRPYTLNGEAVELDTRIILDFVLGRR
jgi:TonB family protein